MKIFISLPMKGRSDEAIEKEIALTSEYLKARYPGCEILHAFFTDDDFKPEGGDIAMKYLGRSIQVMADADLVFFASGWITARGCRMEYLIAREYGKRIESIDENRGLAVIGWNKDHFLM